ncbi:MAG: type III-A CRISPR-associated protein Csm2 [Epulopiscium sp. Nele67-Bin004]|nr:MAG: type III-A CRISPR-associated protein Csm2 [Epulopiscium sp. Nele67-Bin004]
MADYNNYGRNQGGRGNQGGNGRQGGRPQAPTGPTKTDELLKFFNNGLRKDGKLRPEVVMTQASNMANLIAESRETRSQLRAFFSECKGIQYKMTDEQSFENHAQDIWMLKAKSAYKYRNGARDGKIKEPLYKLINAGVDYVSKENTYESFQDFMKFFEAVVGYSYNTGIAE